jgi:hypothetical protein
LANADIKRYKTESGHREAIKKKLIGISGRSEDTQWPARPGEEQYEWEEPRVTEVIGKLGRTIDGTACGVDAIANRVDRLRLLGNGIVPACAELAWRTLWKEMNK